MSRHNEPAGSTETERTDGEYVFGGWAYQSEHEPTEVVAAEGVRFTDASGTELVDLSGQLMCSNLGHSASAVSAAIAD